MSDPRRTLALLPFAVTRQTPGDAAFARAFAYDLTGELARFAPLEVIHPQSSFALVERGHTPEEVAAKLGAGFLVCGRVGREGEAVRVTAELIDAATGRHAWGERYEVAAREVGEVEEEIAGQIAGQVAAALALQVEATRLRRARRAPLPDLEAYDLWVRGMELLRGGTLEDDLQARRLFARAREIEPTFARAHVGLSLSYFNDWSCQAWERWDENEAHAFEHARRAVELDESDAVAHMVLGRVELYRRQFDRAARHVDLALELNPNDPDLLIQLCLAKALLGEGDEALALGEKAMRLHPLHPDWYFALAALAHLIARDLRPGLAYARKAWKATVDLPAFVAAAEAELGEREAAAEHLRVFGEEFREKVLFGREPEPGEALRWILHVNPFRHEEDVAFLVDALRKAGLDEDPDAARHAVPFPGSGAGEAGAAVFRKEGALWNFVFQGERVQLAEVKGFGDLARLLAQPGRPVHAIELADRVAPAHDDEPVLDARARRETEARIRELQEELEDAEAAHDLGRAEGARRELDALVDALARSLGLGGRTRRLGSAGERARTAVTWRIRSALRKIARAHPALGRHLENAVRTGTTCIYRPEQPVDWQL